MVTLVKPLYWVYNRSKSSFRYSATRTSHFCISNDNFAIFCKLWGTEINWKFLDCFSNNSNHPVNDFVFHTSHEEQCFINIELFVQTLWYKTAQRYQSLVYDYRTVVKYIWFRVWGLHYSRNTFFFPKPHSSENCRHKSVDFFIHHCLHYHVTELPRVALSTQ